jgi:hypothetical protein
VRSKIAQPKIALVYQLLLEQTSRNETDLKSEVKKLRVAKLQLLFPVLGLLAASR